MPPSSLHAVVEVMPLLAVGVSGIGRVVTAVQGTTVVGHGVQAVDGGRRV